ncbi:MAG: sensor histidine kinase, partial [Lachnospiraceae bacterium]|nr:sensor histidine kinase [Lachnospiraceae bacterium]
MNSEALVWIFGIGLLLCMLLLVFVVIYFLKEWKILESILENFQSGNIEGVRIHELYETRESKMVTKLLQILGSARFKEERAMEEKDQVMELISDLSHQLKTPLANIVMNMELLRGDALTEVQQKEFLEHTETQVEKMQWLMNSLLKASQLENGMIQFQAENTGIKATIAKAVGSVYAQASAKQIQLSVEEFQDFELYH